MADQFTDAIHADKGIEDTPDIAPPIRVTTTYARDDQMDLVYRRDQHPTRERLEAVVGALEGGHATVYPTGMAAITSLMRHLRPKQVYLPDDVYHGVRLMVGQEAATGAWSIAADPSDLGGGDVWFIETPSNPKCLITDISAAVEAVKGTGTVVVVDSTFATPVLQQPLALGADFVLHSGTKFINGHSDAMGGFVIAAGAATAAALREERRVQGFTPGPLDLWLTLRGVRTLPLRVARQSETAGAVAAFLTNRVEKVWYPGLPGHPGHDIANRQMSGYGSVLSFEVVDAGAASQVMRRLRLIRVATSLGGVETLAEHRYTVNPAAPPGLIRVSVGLEAPQDLIADLDQAVG
jgi:cystathionine gamma-synthase